MTIIMSWARGTEKEFKNVISVIDTGRYIRIITESGLEDFTYSIRYFQDIDYKMEIKI